MCVCVCGKVIKYIFYMYRRVCALSVGLHVHMSLISKCRVCVGLYMCVCVCVCVSVMGTSCFLGILIVSY